MPRSPDILCAGGCGRLLWRGRGSLDEPTCRECRKSRPRSTPQPNDVCSQCGKPVFRAPSSAAQIICLECRKARCAPRPCEACGKIFKPDRKNNSKRTDRACRRVPCGIAVRMGMTLAEYEAHAARKAYQATVTEIEWWGCAGCLRIFPDRRGGDRQYCSAECYRRSRYRIDPAYRAKKAQAALNRRADRLGLNGVKVLPNLLAWLYERDRGICGLCGEPVTELDGPWRPSVDHIVPLSRGGLHVPSNIWLAHYRCNLRKCARMPAAEIVTVVRMAGGYADL